MLDETEVGIEVLLGGTITELKSVFVVIYEDD